MDYDIPDIYNDSYSSKKNNLEIINLIDDNINNFSKENISFKLTEYELFNINDENKHIIIIKTNYNKDFALETDGDLPECTPEQMWEKPTTYAVKKVGNKRATNVFNTKEEALNRLDNIGSRWIFYPNACIIEDLDELIIDVLDLV